jgi:hypothetical protein
MNLKRAKEKLGEKEVKEKRSERKKEGDIVVGPRMRGDERAGRVWGERTL